MKKYLLLLTLICIGEIAFSQIQTVPLDSVQYYRDKTVTVCAKVQGVYESKNKTTILSFGHPYPKHTFSVVIFGKDVAAFSYYPSEFLKDKMICITGEVKMYKDKPEIIVQKPEQIKTE